MSDDEFAEHLHLAKDSGGKENQGRRAAVEKKEKKGDNDSEDDPEELGPTQQPGRGTSKLATSHRQQPSTPLTRAQAAIRRAAAQQQRQNQAPTPSPPLTRAQSAKKQACEGALSPAPRMPRLDPGLPRQPRVVLSPIDRDIPAQTPVPPDMANYYHNYKSPGKGKTWGPANKHPPNRPRVAYPEFPANSNLADGKGPLPRQRRTPWQPPPSNFSTTTPPQIRSLPDVSMESISGLDAFRPRQYEEPPILEGDAPSYKSSSPSDYQEASAIDPDYQPEEDDADTDDL